MDRPGVAAQVPPRCDARPGDHRAPRAVLPRATLGRGELVRPADRRTEEAALVGGLVGAGATQLVGAVGGEHQQRHPGMAGLEHGRVQVGDGGARRRDHRHRPPGQLGQAEGEEAGRALVHADVQPQPPGRVGLLQRVGQRRRPRPRAEHRLTDATSDHLVHEHGGQGCRRVHSPDPAASALVVRDPPDAAQSAVMTASARSRVATTSRALLSSLPKDRSRAWSALRP